MNRLAPKKFLGQHFLQDSAVINEIVEQIAPSSEDHMVEIGPGLGAITECIWPKVKQLELIEVDRVIAARWRQRAQSISNLKVHEADALKFDLRTLPTRQEKIRLVGNLPYNISIPLLFHCIKQLEWIEDMHFMFQKEVAKRICSQPGSRHYGRLSVILQYHCVVSTLFDIPPQAFDPPPKVRSSFLRIEPRSIPKDQSVHVNALDKVLHAGFSSRRKMLKHNLSELLTRESIEQLGIDPCLRPEQLSLEQFVRLAQSLS